MMMFNYSHQWVGDKYGGENINSALLIFDYFKEAFRLNRANKVLYRPQLVLVLVRVLLLVGLGIGAWSWMGGGEFTNLVEYGPQDWRELVSLALGASMALGGTFLVYFLVSRLLEAGLFNMFKSAVKTGKVDSQAFWQGVSRYWLKFLLGDILVAMIMLILLPVRGLVGLVTLSAGFAIFGIVVSVFLMFWKVSLVWNDKGIIAAFGDSLGFARDNFLAVFLLFLTRQAFISPVSGGNFNTSSTNFNLGEFPNGIGYLEGQVVVDSLRLLTAIMIPVIIIIVVSLITMIFQVFFGLTLFVAYKRGFNPEEEVGPDVV